MAFRLVVLAASLAVLTAFAGAKAPAEAQQQRALCGSHTRILEEILGGKFQEMPILEMSIKENGGLPLRLYANEKTGTWTAVVLRPDGIACVVMAGYGIKPVIIPVGDPA